MATAPYLASNASDAGGRRPGMKKTSGKKGTATTTSRLAAPFDLNDALSKISGPTMQQLITQSQQAAQNDIAYQVAAYRAQQDYENQLGQQRAASILRAGQATRNYLSGLAPQVQQEYQSAVDNTRSLAQGFSGQLADDLNARAAQQQADITAGGSQVQVSPPGQGIAAVLSGLSGVIPTDILGAAGRAATAQAQAYPSQAYAAAQQESVGALGAAADRAREYAGQILATQGKLPSLVNQYLTQYQDIARQNRQDQIANLMGVANYNLDVGKLNQDITNSNRNYALDVNRFGLDANRYGLDVQKYNTDVANANREYQLALKRYQLDSSNQDFQNSLAISKYNLDVALANKPQVITGAYGSIGTYSPGSGYQEISPGYTPPSQVPGLFNTPTGTVEYNPATGTVAKIPGTAPPLSTDTNVQTKTVNGVTFERKNGKWVKSTLPKDTTPSGGARSGITSSLLKSARQMAENFYYGVKPKTRYVNPQFDKRGDLRPGTGIWIPDANSAGAQPVEYPQALAQLMSIGPPTAAWAKQVKRILNALYDPGEGGRPYTRKQAASAVNTAGKNTVSTVGGASGNLLDWLTG